MAKERLTNAKMLTVIGDLESDISAVFQRVPDEKTHLIVRAWHDRILDDNEKISEHFHDIAFVGTHEINLPKITGQRKARGATLSIKHSNISFYDKSTEEAIEVNCVIVTETSRVPKDESPISWVLLTTHDVNLLEDAMQILTWYTWRWVIEQIFRIIKNKGLQIEDSQIETPAKLLNMSSLCLAAAIKIMSLVEARDGKTKRRTSDLFSKEEIILLTLLCKKLEGKTEKQQNSFDKNNLAWTAWIIARLGG